MRGYHPVEIPINPPGLSRSPSPDLVPCPPIPLTPATPIALLNPLSPLSPLDRSSPSIPSADPKAEQQEFECLRSYIVGDKSKRPSVIKFTVSWKLCSRKPVQGRFLERFEAIYNTGTAFAITPYLLLTTRHTFRPPTAIEVVIHADSDPRSSLEEIEECIKYERWVISSIQWCGNDSDHPFTARRAREPDSGYELYETFVLGSDLVFLQSLRKEHHCLTLGVAEPPQLCCAVHVDGDNEIQFQVGTMIWNEGMDDIEGTTTCSAAGEYPGSPNLDTKGCVVGLGIGTVKGHGMDGWSISRFYGSAFLFKCFMKCFPQVVKELKPGAVTELKACLLDKFVHAATAGSAEDYTRTFNFHDHDLDPEDKLTLESALKRS
ncbi:hypothetical protein TWF481_003388 [Arthrobotrys musiformis]|uniref:Uncharacterized protein n=1 Tax=Arthrobotrys musiformis TaxID=47236 RepID=A0AAV9VS76_9PEZI